MAGSQGGELYVILVAALTLTASVAVATFPFQPPEASTTHRSLLGTVPYHGPRDALGLQAYCRSTPTDYESCVTEQLKSLLLAEGSVVAFDLLDNLTRIDSHVNTNSHPIAHSLGRHSFQVYPTIHDALSACSYKVFQGCLHGAQQSYFDSLASMDEDVVRTTCPEPRNNFEEYACLHGLGHGLMLNTNYAMNASLALCDALVQPYVKDPGFAQSSCWGGVFMENLVGWIDSQTPTAAGGHDHGHVGPPPVFMVDSARPTYPCDVMAPRYQASCWQLQTSLILRFNGGYFAGAAAACDEAGAHVETCYRSLGRDAAPYSHRVPTEGSRLCSFGTPEGRAWCVKGYISEGIHNDATPYVGVTQCPLFPEVDRTPCYEETVGVSYNFLPAPADRRALCDAFPTEQQAMCRRVAGV